MLRQQQESLSLCFFLLWGFFLFFVLVFVCVFVFALWGGEVRVLHVMVPNNGTYTESTDNINNPWRIKRRA